LLGEQYKDKFEVGQYIQYRRICRDENFEATFKYYQGIIVSINSVESGGRQIWYAKIMKNGGETELILLSKIRKIETN